MGGSGGAVLGRVGDAYGPLCDDADDVLLGRNGGAAAAAAALLFLALTSGGSAGSGLAADDVSLTVADETLFERDLMDAGGDSMVSVRKKVDVDVGVGATVVRRRSCLSAQVALFFGNCAFPSPVADAFSVQAAAVAAAALENSPPPPPLAKTRPSSTALTVVRFFFMRLSERLMSVLVDDQLRRSISMRALAASANREMPCCCCCCCRRRCRSSLSLDCSDPDRDSGRSLDVSDVVSCCEIVTFQMYYYPCIFQNNFIK